MTEKAKELLSKFDHNLNGVLFDLVGENELLEGQVDELREQVARLTEKQNLKKVDVKLGGEFLGVRQCSVSGAWRDKGTCKGWKVTRLGHRADMRGEAE